MEWWKDKDAVVNLAGLRRVRIEMGTRGGVWGRALRRGAGILMLAGILLCGCSDESADGIEDGDPTPTPRLVADACTGTVPSVQILEPAEDTQFKPGETFEFSALVTDPDQSASTLSVGLDLMATSSLGLEGDPEHWDLVPDGAGLVSVEIGIDGEGFYSLLLSAEDDCGLIGDASIEVSVQDDAPSIGMEAVSSSQVLSGGTLHFNGTAADSDDALSSLEVRIVDSRETHEEVAGVTVSGEWFLDVVFTAPGEHIVAASVTDPWGKTTLSDQVKVDVIATFP